MKTADAREKINEGKFFFIVSYYFIPHNYFLIKLKTHFKSQTPESITFWAYFLKLFWGISYQQYRPRRPRHMERVAALIGYEQYNANAGRGNGKTNNSRKGKILPLR